MKGFLFQAAVAFLATGAEAQFSMSCKSTVTESGTSGTITHGTPYQSNEYACWYIPCTDDLQLTFTSFNTEPNYDFVAAYEWDGSVRTERLRESGSVPPDNLIIPTGSSEGVVLEFTSDTSVEDDGFVVTYECSAGGFKTATLQLPEGSCSAPSVLSGSSFLYPSQPPYDNDEDVCFLIPCTQTLTLVWNSFDTEQNYDFVNIKVIDGSNVVPAETYSGTSIPSTRSYSGGGVMLQFTSDSSQVRDGFRLTWTCNNDLPTCVTINTPSVAGASGNYQLIGSKFWVKVPNPFEDSAIYFLTHSDTSNKWVLKDPNSQILYEWSVSKTASPVDLVFPTYSLNGDTPTITICTTSTQRCFDAPVSRDCVPGMLFPNDFTTEVSEKFVCLSEICACGAPLVPLPDQRCTCQPGYFFSYTSFDCVPMCEAFTPSTVAHYDCQEFDLLVCKPQFPMVNGVCGCTSNVDCFPTSSGYSGITGATCNVATGECTCPSASIWASGRCQCTYGLDSASQSAMACVEPAPVCNDVLACLQGFDTGNGIPDDFLMLNMASCNNGHCICGGVLSRNLNTGLCECGSSIHAYNENMEYCMRIASSLTCSGVDPEVDLPTCTVDSPITCKTGILPGSDGQCSQCSHQQDCLSPFYSYSSTTYTNQYPSCTFESASNLNICNCGPDMVWEHGACRCSTGSLTSSGHCQQARECFSKLDCVQNAVSTNIPLFEIPDIAFIECNANLCSCGGKAELTAEGLCGCPSWAVWSSELQDCVPLCTSTFSSTEICTSGQPLKCQANVPWFGYQCNLCTSDQHCSPSKTTLIPGATCDTVTGTCSCGSGLIWSMGACRCAGGVELLPDGTCPSCQSDNECMNVNGMPVDVTHEGARCVGGVCECLGGLRTASNSRCECLVDFSYDTYSCISCSFARDCFEHEPSDMPYDREWSVWCTDGECQCGADYEPSSVGGKCACKSGTFQNVYGLCVQCSSDSHCFSAASYATVGSSITTAICNSAAGTCSCSPYIQKGEKCEICTTDSDCNPNGKAVAGMVCTNNICVCSSPFAQTSSGICGCSDTTLYVDANDVCVARDNGCTTDASCLPGSTGPSLGVTCDLATGTCSCDSSVAKVAYNSVTNRCGCSTGFSLYGDVCGTCETLQDCLGVTNTLEEGHGVACTNNLCRCSGDYELSKTSLCQCKLPASGNVATLDPLTGVCISACSQNDHCLEVSGTPAGDNAKCVNGECICGFATDTYDSDWVRTVRNKCKYEPITTIVSATSEDIIERFCSVDQDCYSVGAVEVPTAAQVSCNFDRGVCICKDGYELYSNTLCRKVGDTAIPTAQISISMLYSDKLCNDANHEELIASMRKLWATAYEIDDDSTIDVELKCGSIGIQIRLQILAELLRVNTRSKFRELMSSDELLFLLGEPGLMNAAAGTSLCPIGFPVLAAEMFHGVCQPIKCEFPYTLIKQDSLSGTDSCYDLSVTPLPDVVRTRADDAEDKLLETVVVIVGCCLIVLIVVVSCILFLRYRSIETGLYLPKPAEEVGVEEGENLKNEDYPDKD